MILERILSLYSGLSTTEKKIAQYILDKPDDVIHYSIIEFSKIIDASETSIFRFVKKLGFEGYQQFKIELTKEISGTQVKELEGPETLEEYISDIENLIRRLRKTLNEKDVETVSEWMIKSKKIIFFGVGLSSVAAEYGSLLLSLLGFPSFYYNDPHTQVIVASGLTSEDLVISVSHSGNIRDTVKSTQVAKDMGAKTVAITAGVNSPLSQTANITLYSPPAKVEKHEFIRGNIGEMALVEILFKIVLQKVAKEKSEHLDELSKVLKPKAY